MKQQKIEMEQNTMKLMLLQKGTWCGEKDWEGKVNEKITFHENLNSSTKMNDQEIGLNKGSGKIYCLHL